MKIYFYKSLMTQVLENFHLASDIMEAVEARHIPLYKGCRFKSYYYLRIIVLSSERPAIFLSAHSKILFVHWFSEESQCALASFFTLHETTIIYTC